MMKQAKNICIFAMFYFILQGRTNNQIYAAPVPKSPQNTPQFLAAGSDIEREFWEAEQDGDLRSMKRIITLAENFTVSCDSGQKTCKISQFCGHYGRCYSCLSECAGILDKDGKKIRNNKRSDLPSQLKKCQLNCGGQFCTMF